MTISYPDNTTPAPPATTAAEEAYVPIYARKPPKKKATPWLMAAPVALAAAVVIGWVAMSSDGDAPAAPVETAELTALNASAPLASTDDFTETAPLEPVRPAAAEPAPIAATAAPVRRTAAPAPRRAALQSSTPAPAPVEVEEAVASGPQPYLAEADTAPVAPGAAETGPILIAPQPLD